VERFADLDTVGDELGTRGLDVGDDQVQVLDGAGAADVTFVPNWIEHSEPAV